MNFCQIRYRKQRSKTFPYRHRRMAKHKKFTAAKALVAVPV